MKTTLFVLPALGLGLVLSAPAQSPGKIGVINIQGAIISTKDGQKAAGEIQSRFTPKKAELDKRQGEIGQLQDQLNRGRNTLSEEYTHTTRIGIRWTIGDVSENGWQANKLANRSHGEDVNQI